MKEALHNAAGLKEEDWHKAYPRNHPSSAGQGLAAMRETILKNLALVDN